MLLNTCDLLTGGGGCCVFSIQNMYLNGGGSASKSGQTVIFNRKSVVKHSAHFGIMANTFWHLPFECVAGRIFQTANNCSGYNNPTKHKLSGSKPST